MVKLCDGKKVKRFEYLYLFVMIIYLAQMTPRMSRMTTGLTGDWFVLLLPIFLTYILCNRNRISFESSELRNILLAITLWSVMVIIKMNLFSFSRLNDYVFIPYIMIIAYIHNKVYGKNIFTIYEHIMLIFCQISIPLWLISSLVPGISLFWNLFPETNIGNNFLMLYNWYDPSRHAEMYVRNSGCSWEPGRFACMILVAVAINLSRNGVKFRDNKPLLWFIITIITTQSTTAYSGLILIMSIFWLKKKMSHIISFLVLGIPIIVWMFSLDFMGEKIYTNMNFEENMEQTQTNLAWNESNGGTGYFVSLGRLEAIYYEATVNIPHDPILGYGRNYNESWFSKSVSDRLVLTGGLLKVLSEFGVPLGLFFYLILFRSSKRFAENTEERKRWALFAAFIIISISYKMWGEPVWTAMWFYSVFKPDADYIPNFIRE